VVLDDQGTLDGEATAARRACLTAERGNRPLPAFSFGPARDRHHALWTDDVYAAIDHAVRNLPAVARPLRYQQIRDAVERLLEAGQPVTASAIAALAQGFEHSAERRFRA
jgi:hypothetical protein